MFFLYPLREAYQSLNTHRARTISMGFGVFWAIFILVLLLGIGNGLRDGISKRLEKYAAKTMVIYKRPSSVDWHSIPAEIPSNLSENFSSIQHVTPVCYSNNPTAVVYREKMITPHAILGFDPCYALLTNISIREGRFFTTHDAAEASNLCVIGLNIKETLFGNSSAIGKHILLGSTSLQVVGVLDVLDYDFYGEGDAILLLNSFLKKLLPRYNHYVDYIHLALLPNADIALAEAQFRSYFARHLNCDGQEGISIFSMTKLADKVHNFFRNFVILTWVIGICVLFTGIVGISNMMLVAIRERTQEIAIRGILGGSSIEIVVMIVYEIVIITLMAGIAGFGVSFVLMKLLNQWVVPLLKTYFLATLACPPELVFMGLVLLLVASCLAAIVPAVRALQIKPVQALSER